MAKRKAKKKPRKGKPYTTVSMRNGEKIDIRIKLFPAVDITSEDLVSRGISHVVNKDGSLDLTDEIKEAKIRKLLEDLDK
jgi:hypothetical protein